MLNNVKKIIYRAFSFLPHKTHRTHRTHKKVKTSFIVHPKVNFAMFYFNYQSRR